MVRISLRRILPFCFGAFYTALMLMSSAEWKTYYADPSAVDHYARAVRLNDVAMGLNLPALFMVLPFVWVLVALGCPETWASGTMFCIFWYLVGRWFDRYLERRALRLVEPALMRPFLAWSGFLYSAVMGGAIWIGVVEHAGPAGLWVVIPMGPGIFAAYFGFKILQWRNANSPSIPSVTHNQ
jgi:hypothetical protein